jgi:hypothetical protein
MKIKNLFTLLIAVFFCANLFSQVTPTPIASPRISLDYFYFSDSVTFGTWAYPYTGIPVVNLQILPGAIPLDNTDSYILTFDETTKRLQYREVSSLGVITSYNSPLSLSGSTLSLLYQMSITSDASGLKFVNDQTSPGNNYIYGTSSAGVKGWRKIKKADLDDLDATEVVFGDWSGSGNAQTSNDLTYNSLSHLYLNGKFGVGVPLPLEQIHISGNFRFPSTTSTTGIFYKDATRILHFYGNNNIFLGGNSGNFTTSAGLFNGSNIGIGLNTLNLVSTGYFNTCLGSNAGQAITTGFGNTYLGFQSGRNNTGSSNLALGSDALYGTAGLSTGSENTAVGKISANLLTTGTGNTTLGFASGETITTGNYNTFIGYLSGNDVPTITGSYNILLGYDLALPTTSTSNYMSIGNILKGNTSTGVLTIPTNPTDDNTNTLVLSRDATTGDIEEVEISSIVDADATGVACTDCVTLTTETSGNYVTSVATTSPLSGGAAGSEGAALTLSISNSAADGSTKGAASFTANDFDATSGNISIDYTNGQAATSGQDGFLQSSDWTTFNNKVGVVDVEEYTSQTGSLGATTTYTTPASDGYYRISVTATVTTAAGTTMDLAVQLRYTEATDNVVKTFPTANVNNYNRTQTNTTGASVSITSVCHIKASTNIQFLTSFSPTGGSPQYNVHVTVEKLQ